MPHPEREDRRRPSEAGCILQLELRQTRRRNGDRLINAYWQPLDFVIREGDPEEWKRTADTSLDAPNDFIDACDAPMLASLNYKLQPRLIAPFRKHCRVLSEVCSGLNCAMIQAEVLRATIYRSKKSNACD